MGIVHLVDRFALEAAVAKLKAQPARHLGGQCLRHRGVAIRPGCRISWTMSAPTSDVAPRLIVELTETAALHHFEENARFVSQLRELGVRVAIDDFGAGYTSFRNLQMLHVDTVKIDGSYVKDLSQSPENQVFVRTLVGLARNFDIKTVAEWVGSDDDAALLQSFGVDYFQGFHFGEPLIDPDIGAISSSVRCLVPDSRRGQLPSFSTMTVNFWRGASKSTSQRFLIFWVCPRVTAPQRPLQYLVSRCWRWPCASRVVMGATQPASTATAITMKAPPKEQRSFALAQLGELAAHRFHLFLEIGDFARCGFGAALRFARPWRRGAEGREHRHGIFEHLQVLAGQVFHHLIAAAQASAMRSRIGALVLGEAVHAHVQIAGHESLQAVAIEADQLAQELDRQQRLALGLFLENDLGQDRAGDVLAGARILHFEFGAFLHHRGQVIQVT